MEAALRSSDSYSEALTKLGLREAGGNYGTLRRFASERGIDISHMERKGRGWAKGQEPPNAVPLEDVLRRGTKYRSSDLKRRLIAAGLLEECCEECKIGPEWNGQPLTLELDHVDGDRFNNERENLRLLCPNCHSQTPTFRGRKNRIAIKVQRRSTPRLHKRKVVRPSYDELLSLLQTMSKTAIGVKYGVSDNAVNKWLKCYEKRL
jgi:hypothetical protein